jgi:hypothetical protein
MDRGIEHCVVWGPGVHGHDDGGGDVVGSETVGLKVRLEGYADRSLYPL